VVLDSSKSKVAFGTAVSFTAKVSGGNKPPTGPITFYDGTTVLGETMDLSNGQARLTVSNLSIGTHSITAKYSGDSSHKESGSQALYEAITGVTTLQVVATSGDLSHTLNINLAVQ
jgi:Bacterial Ig-like domain (group 3)